MSDNKELAKLAKGRGNAAFQAGDFTKAIEEFTAAIELDNTDHVFFSNRYTSTPHTQQGYFSYTYMYRQARVHKHTRIHVQLPLLSKLG